MKPTEDPDLFRFGSSLGLHQSAPKSTDISLPQLRFWCRPQYICTSAWAAEPKNMHARQRCDSKSLCIKINYQRHGGRTIFGFFVFLCISFSLQQILTQEESTWSSVPLHPSTAFSNCLYYTYVGTCLDWMKSFFIPLTVWNVEDQSITSHNLG